MHILIVSKSNLKLQVFGLYLPFVRTLIIKVSISEEPANSTSIHRVRNSGKLVIIFHPSPKNWQKGVDHPVENPRKRAENIEMAPNKFYWRMRRRNTPLLTQAPLLVANSCTREIRAVRVCNTLVMHHECKRNLHCLRPATVAYDFRCLKQNLSGGFTISCCNTNRSRQSPRKWLFFSLLWI